MAAGIVIVGAGPAGITIAESVRRHDPSTPVTVLSAEPFAPYSPPAMADYFMTGREASLYWKGTDLCERLNMDYRSGVSVSSLDTADQCLQLEDGSRLAYDQLVIASGSGLYMPLEGHDLDGIYNFKSLSAARRLVESVNAGDVRDAVIVGAGFIGVEVAVLLAGLDVDVTMVEMEDRLMPGMLDPETAAIVLDKVNKRGIQVRTQTKATAFVGDARVEGIELDDGETLRAHACIGATGVKPNIDWLEGSGIETDWGVLADDRMRTNIPDIYAAGDVAESFDRMTGERYVHAIFPNAIAQAEVVTAGLLGYEAIYDGGEAMNSLKHLGEDVIAVGAQQGSQELRRRTDSSLRKIFLDEEDRIIGFRLVGDIRSAGVYRSLMLRRINITPFKQHLLDSRPGAPWLASLADMNGGTR